MLEIPRFLEEGYMYFDEKNEKYGIKEEAPEWAKKEFEEYMKLTHPVPDENGIIAQC